MILDPSAALLAALPDLSNTQRQRLAHVIFAAAMAEPVAAPDLYVYEAGHALFVRRRQEIGSAGDRLALYRDLLSMVKLIHPNATQLAAAGDLAGTALSFYDAAYVTLAAGLREPLVTADRAMHLAARRHGVESYLLPRHLARMERRYFGSN